MQFYLAISRFKWLISAVFHPSCTSVSLSVLHPCQRWQTLSFSILLSLHFFILASHSVIMPPFGLEIISLAPALITVLSRSVCALHRGQLWSGFLKSAALVDVIQMRVAAIISDRLITPFNFRMCPTTMWSKQIIWQFRMHIVLKKCQMRECHIVNLELIHIF